MIHWFVEHVRTGTFLAVDHTEPNGRTWVDSLRHPAVVTSTDPDALASRIHQTLPPELLPGLRLVPVQSRPGAAHATT